MSHDAELVAKVAEALNEEGAAPGSSIHSWRCEYPDQYGECDCVAETARAVLDALDLPGIERRARAEALRETVDAAQQISNDRAKALIARIAMRTAANWLRARAAELDPEEADDA